MNDPYARNMFGKINPYYAKRQVAGRLAVVLDGTFADRGLVLIKPPSRALLSGEIHELIITNENTQPGAIVNDIAYLGFVEIAKGGVIVVGDVVRIKGKEVGKIAGFDETHMPNHLNIVVSGEKVSGRGVGLTLEDDVVIG